MTPDVERRQLAARDAQVGIAGRTIAGYAAVFNSRSADLGGFREVILPGAFDRSLKEHADVRALLDHDPRLILGRTKSGTLRLKVDAHGLRAEIDAPNTQAARDAVASIRRGDLDGMSFAFGVPPGGDRWSEKGGEAIRELVEVQLYDVSVVAFPAYEATSVSARALARGRGSAPARGPRALELLRLRLRING